MPSTKQAGHHLLQKLHTFLPLTFFVIRTSA